jgi:hypothetical protein
MRDRPDLAVWWMAQETRMHSTFRIDCPSYADLARQQDLFADGDLETVECYCHD